uniref:NADH-cytochrome b5 reductase n=1 Tax=Trypanosoma congolense (strain IL3000) TaxID=1068625 RepID=G0V001_TRYCI|nr:unnamed protein product [Trypanosoma congolense IL3000]
MLAIVVACVLTFVAAWFFYSRRALCADSRMPNALIPDKYQPFRLVKKSQVTHDCFVFRFALHSPEQRLGLPTGQHVRFRVESSHNAEGRPQPVQHSYTPISSNDEKGYVDFLVKVYYKGVSSEFPHGGRLSQHLDGLRIGDTVEMMGPLGTFQYLGNGDYTVELRKGQKHQKHVSGFAMIAGGTGITPMLQVIRAIVKSPDDPTRVWLVFSNHTEWDILLREVLDECCRDGRVKVWYTLTREAPPAWAHGTGRVNEEMFRAHLPPPKLEHGPVTALICGPPLMVQDAVKPNLLKIGYSPDDMFVF